MQFPGQHESQLQDESRYVVVRKCVFQCHVFFFSVDMCRQQMLFGPLAHRGHLLIGYSRWIFICFRRPCGWFSWNHCGIKKNVIGRSLIIFLIKFSTKVKTGKVLVFFVKLKIFKVSSRCEFRRKFLSLTYGNKIKINNFDKFTAKNSFLIKSYKGKLLKFLLQDIFL